MLLTVPVLIKELPSDSTVLYSSLSAIGGAITGSAIMYFAKKKLQTEDRKTRLTQKKIECYGAILKCYRSSVFSYKHNQKWVFDYKEFNEKVTPKIEEYYFYLPVQV